MPVTTPEQQRLAAEAARKDSEPKVEEPKKPAVSVATGTSPAKPEPSVGASVLSALSKPVVSKP